MRRITTATGLSALLLVATLAPAGAQEPVGPDTTYTVAATCTSEETFELLLTFTNAGDEPSEVGIGLGQMGDGFPVEPGATEVYETPELPLDGEVRVFVDTTDFDEADLITSDVVDFEACAPASDAPTDTTDDATDDATDGATTSDASDGEVTAEATAPAVPTRVDAGSAGLADTSLALWSSVLLGLLFAAGGTALLARRRA